ncbi:hypothetical protein BG006_000555 [Podila minutissima]|uniref:Cyanovirin-N domain-containing protein n=1 Tax=Podila minutissima TaxID=64525 RepID=A0A9P5VHQ2_9FUNG|nr:hypothetical protein BG006_000555 [Podila minutissima]
MTFMHSSKDIRLKNNRYLTATCQRKDGRWVESSLDLDTIIGNDDGYFSWEGENFSMSAADPVTIKVASDSVLLRTDLRKANGDWRQGETLELSERIENLDGQLSFV